MKKKDILQSVSEIASEKISERNMCNLDISKEDVKDVLESYFTILIEELTHFGNNFKTPIGTFFTKELKPRKGKTPEGKDFSVGDRTKLSFRQNKQAKDWIENGKLDVNF